MSGHVGDTLRILSGAKVAALQTVYMNKYGSAHPIVDQEDDAYAFDEAGVSDLGDQSSATASV